MFAFEVKGKKKIWPYPRISDDFWLPFVTFSHHGFFIKKIPYIRSC